MGDENGFTSLSVRQSTKARLLQNRIHHDETYDSEINRLLDALQEKTAPKPAAVVP